MTHTDKIARLVAARQELAAAEAALYGPHVDALARLLLGLYSESEMRRLAQYRLHAAAARLPGAGVAPVEVAAAIARLFALEGVPAGTLHEWLVAERPRRAGDIAAALAAWPTYKRQSPADTAPEG